MSIDLVSQSVLVPSEDYSAPVVKGCDFEKPTRSGETDYEDVMDHYATTGFQGTALGQAFEEVCKVTFYPS
jgi:hypothetical protein